MTVKKKTVNTVLLVIYLTVFSKIFGLVRDVLIGYRYGTSLESDAYFAAYRMSITIFLSIGSAITATTIPYIVKFIKSGDRLHQISFINRLVTVMGAITGVVATAGILFAPVYVRMIAVGFEGEVLTLTVRLVRFFFPVIVLVPLVYLMISILQANERFALSSMISIPYNGVLIVYLLLMNGRFGITGLAAATLFGWVGQLALLVVFAKDLRPRLRIDWTGRGEVLGFFGLMAPILLSSAVYNINILVDTAIATTLPDGQLASLNFANIAYTAIATTTIFGISTVLFPQFSALAAEARTEELRARISQAVKVMSFLFMPVIFGLIAVNREVIQVLYQRGTFSLESVGYTSAALIFYVVGMLGFAFQELSNKVFYALKDTRTPFVTSAVTVALNITLDLILVRIWGIRGLALATSVAVTFNGLLLLYLIQRRLGRLDWPSILTQLLRVTGISLIMWGAVWAFNRLTLGLYPQLALSVLLGIAIYYIMSERLGLEEIQYLKNEWNRFRRRDKGA